MTHRDNVAQAIELLTQLNVLLFDIQKHAKFGGYIAYRRFDLEDLAGKLNDELARLDTEALDWYRKAAR